MATIYKINGTTALKAEESQLKLVYSADHSSLPDRNAVKEFLLFQDERMFDEERTAQANKSQLRFNPILFGLAATAITFALCLISTAI